MKRYKKYVGAGILLILCILGALSYQNSKTAAVQYVRKNYTELQEFSEALLQDPPVSRHASYHDWDVNIWDGMVEFNTSAWGKTYRGFYYSPEDIPLGYQNTGMEFSPQGKGWYWEEADGNNTMYTERIMDQWYWFEMHF